MKNKSELNIASINVKDNKVNRYCKSYFFQIYPARSWNRSDTAASHIVAGLTGIFFQSCGIRIDMQPYEKHSFGIGLEQYSDRSLLPFLLMAIS